MIKIIKFYYFKLDEFFLENNKIKLYILYIVLYFSFISFFCHLENFNSAQLEFLKFFTHYCLTLLFINISKSLPRNFLWIINFSNLV